MTTISHQRAEARAQGPGRERAAGKAVKARRREAERGGVARWSGQARSETAHRTGVNNDPNAQPDLKLRELNSQPSTPGSARTVFCTKIGTTLDPTSLSSAAIWMASATAKRRTTTALAPRW